MRVGLDVDEVVARLHEAWLDDYNALYNDRMTVDEFTSWDIHKLVKLACGEKIFALLTPGLYHRVLPYIGGIGAVSTLRRMGHEVFFVSTCGKKGDDHAQAYAKQAWLLKWGFLTEGQGLHSGHLIPCKDKRNAPVDVLVDDYINNVESFRGWSVLMNRPHNAGIKTNKTRINHLSDLAEILYQQRIA